MSDWDEFEQECRDSTSKKGSRCGMEKYLDSMPVVAREAVERALKRSDLEATAIRAALLKRGPGVPSVFTIRGHRRGDCKCTEES